LQNSTQSTDVLIVGAGPSGLMMACQLARHGISFRIIDRKDQSASYSGALILQARSLEILDQMGIANKALEEGIIAQKISISFNGKKPLGLNLKGIGTSLTKFPYLLMIEQSKTEQILTNYIETYGHSIERKTELLHFSRNNVKVTVILGLPDGSEEIVEASYLIAADGGQSLIRKQLNIPFLGKTHQLSLFVLDTRADADLQADEIYFSFTKHASSGIFPLTQGRKRIDGTLSKELNGKKPLAFNDIEKNYADRVSLKIKLYEPEWFSVFHTHQRYASTFRLNRCFLIGDAAHVLSPVGAQGMNTGLQDAYNLAWKLSLVILKKADDPLLDTYQSERQPLAKELIRSTDRAFHLVSDHNFLSETFRLRIAPFLLKTLFPIIEKQRSLGQFLFKGISETGIHYRKNFFTKQASKGIFPRKAPKPGDRLPFIFFNLDGNEINIQNKIKTKEFHLFAFTKQEPATEYKKFAEKYQGILSIEVIPFNPGTAILYKKLGIKDEGCYLIRPDMYIAYRSNKPGNDDVERFLHHYLKGF
jgi:2-polyprenyl-6-methoxyphenol hydroxylase-like FAD-dependent oxidoreductase